MRPESEKILEYCSYVQYTPVRVEFREEERMYRISHEPYAQETGPMAVKAIPDGSHSVTPYLVVSGVATLLDFLTQAFEAQELHRMPRPDGTIMHAEVRIGDGSIR